MSMPLGLRTGPVYLDYNATTPVDPRVVEACLPYLAEHFGNPSSTHAYGVAARSAVDSARSSVAALLGCAADEIVFTGGGSDADTLAIRGAALANRDRGSHVISQRTEHPAISATLDALARFYGFRITRLPVDEHGRVRPDDLAESLTDDTVLVSIMHANGETGTIQPIAELAALAHARGALFHTDAAQSVGKIPVSVPELGVDLLTIAGHKLYAPKGIGALYVRAGLALEPTVYGGGQEGGRRSGTENVALTVALGEAARLVGFAGPSLRDALHVQLADLLPGRIELNGHPTLRLPNTLNISISGVSGRALLAAIPDIAAATGSACHEGVDAPSAVLTAMGLPADRALAAVRLSLGRWTTESDLDRTAKLLATAAQ
jgi:cysteine desulfurase